MSRTVRALPFALLLVTLAGCFHSAGLPAVDAPAWRAGDTWTMVAQNLEGGVSRIEYTALGPAARGTWLFRVEATGAPNQTMHISPRTMRFAQDAANASRPPEWPWPLLDGKTWTFTDSGVEYTATATREKTTTGFGELEAVRVRMSNPSGPVQDMWYAPAVRFWGRVVDHPTNTSTALSAYRLT